FVMPLGSWFKQKLGVLNREKPESSEDLAFRVTDGKGNAWSSSANKQCIKDLESKDNKKSMWTHQPVTDSQPRCAHENISELLEKPVTPNLALHALSLFLLIHEKKGSPCRNRITLLTFKRTPSQDVVVHASPGKHAIEDLRDCHRDLDVTNPALAEAYVKQGSASLFEFTKDELKLLALGVRDANAIDAGFSSVFSRVFETRS
ncbi:MAG: hypothetical protein GY930_06890, partial [bacterium]|nr:hypothetical protein [bacterium]